jgi:hypothetical protein
MVKEAKEFAESQTINMSNSPAYYAQVESSNKIMIKIIKNNKDYARRRHTVLFRDLCTHWISRHGATKVKPFELIQGQEFVLLVEVNLGD